MRVLMGASDPQAAGDVFNNRMKDLVSALGYEVERVNIHKAGRELDITGVHRLEKRRVVVECKAQKAPIGGGDINKFVGVLDAEAGPSGKKPQGYFVSLSGFRDSALQQEEDAGRLRCVLLGPTELMHALVSAGVLAAEADILLQLGAFLGARKFVLRGNLSLVVTEAGWFYLAEYAIGDDINATLFYANGTPVTRATAARILAEVGDMNKDVRWGELLAPAGSLSPTESQRTAENDYREYLVREYGVIRHEGMPSDAELGAARPLKLEELYVPTTLHPVRDVEAIEESDDDDDQFRTASAAEAPKRFTLSEVLTSSRHLSILGPPGSGKSTLVKRLAVAFASNQRREAVSDNLPDLEVLPVVIRCREILPQQESVHDVLSAIPRWAEMPEFAEAFGQLLSERLNAGSVLLLVDGLDEMADQQSRLRFCTQLRTFLSRYPRIRVVVTSRDAGFRLVAGAMSEFTDKYRVAALTTDSIKQLTTAWCKHVYGSSPQDQRRAEGLAASIAGNWRLHRLASTPLLLTMLLVVQRWGGGQELPKRRSLLYRRAVEVLLNTWNVEAHEPVNMDEALPQLGYLAFSMTDAGIQRITHKNLIAILRRARQDMPDVLAYSKDSPTDFVNLVEMRSSLLLHAGFLASEEGAQPAYEFRHLMFQEYLTALALVEDWTPSPGLSPVDWLKSRLLQESWGEVVELTSVLAGRRGAALIEEIYRAFLQAATDEAGNRIGADEVFTELGTAQLLHLLTDCLADDAQVSPEVAEPILELIAESMSGWDPFEAKNLLDSRYSNQLRELVQDKMATDEAAVFSSAAASIMICDRSGEGAEQLLHSIQEGLESDDTAVLNTALSVLMGLSYTYASGFFAEMADDPLDQQLVSDFAKESTATVSDIAASREGSTRLIAIWSLCWTAHLLKLKASQLSLPLMKILIEATLDQSNLAHYSGWLLASTLEEGFNIEIDPDVQVALVDQLSRAIEDPTIPIRKREALAVLGYYVNLNDWEETQDILGIIRAKSEEIVRPAD